MAEVKRTQKEMYDIIVKAIETAELTREQKDEIIEFCEGRIEQLARKKTSGKSKAVNEVTAKVEEFIRDYLEENPNEIVTCGQLAGKATKALELEEICSTQRVVVIMKKLVAEEFAVRLDGKKAEFKKA